jgi:hypothetical protein
VRSRISAVLLVLILGAHARAHAWNNCGHMMVAEVAYQELRRDHPETLKAILALLKKHPRIRDLDDETVAHHIHEEAYEHYLFLLAATWPDMVKLTPKKSFEHNATRFDPEDHREWHYFDLPYNQDGKEHSGLKLDESIWKLGEKKEPANCLQALDKCAGELRDAAKTDVEKAKALCWVMHLIGDIHQPLHCATMYSTNFPEESPFVKGDKGGNLFYLDEKAGRDRFRAELHAYWDDVLGKSMSLSHISQYVRHLAAIHPRSELKKDLAEESSRAWARVSHVLAVEHAYLNGKLELYHDPGEEYFYAAQHLAEKQVALAGYRLADKLVECVK